MTFPDIAKPVYPLKETYPDHSLKMELDDHTVNARPRFTKKIRSFTLQWTHLTVSDFNKLRSFYLNDAHCDALAFDWTYPPVKGSEYAGKTFSVRFDGDLDFELAGPGYYTGTLKLTEA